MRIINSGTPLTGILDIGSDWLLRLPGTTSFPASGFANGFLAARFQLPTVLSTLQLVTPSAVTEWYTPTQQLVDFFPSYGVGESERITTTLPESITISTSTDTNSESTTNEGVEVIDTLGTGTEQQARNGTENSTTNSSTTGREESVATPDTTPTLIQDRVVEQLKPWRELRTGLQSHGGGQFFPTYFERGNPDGGPGSFTTHSNFFVSGSGQSLGEQFTDPDVTITDDSKMVVGQKTTEHFEQIGSTGALNPSRTVETSSATNSVTNQTSAETGTTSRNNTEARNLERNDSGTREGTTTRQGEERRTGGVQVTETQRSVPAAVRYGFKLPRLSYDPNTISLSFSYMPIAEVRLTDTSGKVGISCMYSIRVESNPIQGIAPGDRSSPIRLPNVVPFRVTAYMAIRTETDFGKFGSAREEARKISLRTIGATSDQDILLDREMKPSTGNQNAVPIGNLKDPGQLGTAALSYVSDLGTRLKTSNFAFPLLNDAYLMVNKRGRSLEFMVGSQVLTWEDASVNRTFGVQVIGPTPSYTQSPTPRKSLVYS